MRERRKLPDFAAGEIVDFDRIEIMHAQQAHTAYMLINGCNGLFTDRIFYTFAEAYAALKADHGDEADVDEQVVRVMVSVIPDNGIFSPGYFDENGRDYDRDSR